MDSQWIVELHKLAFDKITSIQAIWDEIGIEACRIEQRKESLSTHLLKMLDEMFNEEFLSKHALLRSIEELKVKICELNSELGLPDFILKRESTLLITEKTLYDRFKYLTDVIANKLKAFKQLKCAEENLSSQLGEEGVVVLYRHVPTDVQLKVVEDNFERLNKEKDMRIQLLNAYQENIKRLFDVVGDEWLSSDTLLKQMLSASNIDQLPLNLEFLDSVKTLMHECKNQVAIVENKCLSLVESLRSLASRLNIDFERQVDIFQKPSINFLKELTVQEEVLKKLRDANLSVYLNSCCQDLRDWWTKCYVCDAERNKLLIERCAFVGQQTDNSMLSSESPREVLLNEMETEIFRWSAYYMEHKTLFEELNTWQKLFYQLKRLEVQRLDSVTLKNRGGILLTIQRQYNQTQREIRRCESLLSSLSAEFSHRDVRVNGTSVNELIKDAYATHEKENHKKLRVANTAADNSRSINSSQCPLSYSARRPGEKRKYTPPKPRNDSVVTIASCRTAPIRSKRSRVDWSLSAVSITPGNRTLTQPLSNPFIDFMDEYSTRNGPLTSSSPILRVALVDCVNQPAKGSYDASRTAPHRTNATGSLAARVNGCAARTAMQQSPAAASTRVAPLHSARKDCFSSPKINTKTPVRHFRTPAGCPPKSAHKPQQTSVRRCDF